MNREDVAMDLTFENLDILRKEVQAAKLLLSECDEIFIEEGISNIELRGYLSGKLSADEVIELLDPPAEQRNQCDGCQAGIPLVDGAHRMGRPGGYPDLMSCQKERYKHPEQAEDDIKKLIVLLRHGDAMPGEQDLAADHLERLLKAEQAEGAQGEREATPNPSCSICRGSGYFCEFSTVETCWCCLPEPEPEETVEALKERIESLKAAITHMKQQRDAAVARAALAQPSQAPELERPEVVAWALQRKRDGFVRATWHQKPSETQYEIAELDGDVIAPLYAAPSVSTWKAPEGFALVPIEPTVAMRMPWKTMRGYSWHSKYKAMLAAAAVQRGEL